VSSALAMAAATEAMRKLLEQWLSVTDVDTALGGAHATVSSVPPDQLTLSGAGAKVGLNLFLHRVSLNQGWRNVDLPAVDSTGTRVSSPPLAVDLHFVLSAYGTGELQPETLLGHGMQALQRHPVITRPELIDLLPGSLAASGLATQVEQLRIVPEQIAGEEASRLWSAFQARYRPSFYYCVSVVLIEVTAPVRSALPVLARGGVLPSGDEQGVDVAADLLPRFPTLAALHPANSQQVTISGGVVTVEGDLLAGTERVVRLIDLRRNQFHTVNAGAGTESRRFSFTVPAAVPAGTYDVTVDVQRTATAPTQTTNRLPLTVAPRITSPFPINVTRDPNTDATINLTCGPTVGPDQAVSLILGTREIGAEPHPTPTTNLRFVVRDAPVGSHLTRLRVDGIESILVNRTVTPPVFLNQRVVIA
jgi:hypothetical protein